MQRAQTRAGMEALEEQMQNPGVQAQMAQMQAVMQNPQIMQRMAEPPGAKPLIRGTSVHGLSARWAPTPAFWTNNLHSCQASVHM